MIEKAVEWAAIAVFLSGAASFGLLLKGCIVLRRQARRSATDTGVLLLKSPLTPIVSVVAVASDYSPANRSFVRRLLDLHLANHEVVLVLDAAPEQDFEQWRSEFHLAPTVQGRWHSLDPLRITVVRTDRPGVAAAYNAGVAAASGSLIALFDSASEFIPEVLLRMLPSMLQNPEQITAVCGIAPDLGSGSLIQQFASVESVRLWLSRCAAFGSWNLLLPVPGSCLLIRREAIQKAGGFPKTAGYLTDSAAHLQLVLHLHGRARTGGPPFRMVLVPEPVSRVPSPKSGQELRRILDRDQNALKSAVVHQNLIARGMFAARWAMPALIWDRLLRPLVETLLYAATVAGIALGVLPVQAGLLVLLCTAATGIWVSMGAVLLREVADYNGGDPKQLASLFLAAIPENLGYRQWRNLLLIQGFFKRKTR